MPLAPPINQIQQPEVGIYGLPVGASAGSMVLLTAAQIRALADSYSISQVDSGLAGKANTTHSHSASDVTSGTFDVARLGSGSVGAGAKYLADDATWKTIDLSAYLTSSTAASTYLPLAGGTLTGDLKFTDATYDIGKSGATRPRDGFFSRDITVGRRINLTGSADSTYPTLRIGRGAGTLHFNGTSDASVLIHGTDGDRAQFEMLSPNQTQGIILQAVQGYGAFIQSKGGDFIVDLSTFGNVNWKLATASTQYGLGFTASTSSAADLIVVRDAANTLAVKNGTNSQTFRLYNTYTSSTSYENLQFKANSGAAYQIGSAVGSAGGTNRGINFGVWDSSGTFTSYVTLSGTTSNSIILGVQGTTAALLIQNNGNNIYHDATAHYFRSLSGGTTYAQILSSGFSLNCDLLFADATYDIGKSGATRPRDQYLSRNLTVGGEINLTNASSQTLRIAMDTNNPVISSATTRMIVGGTSIWLRTDGGVLFMTSSDSEMGRVSISGFNTTFQSNTNGSLTLTVPTSANSNQGANAVNVTGQTALSSSINVLGGGAVNLTGGNGASASAGNAYGGDVVITGGTGYGTGRQGRCVILSPITNTSTGITEIRNSTTAQTLRVYNTYTSSTSGEWGEFDWQTTSNVLRIGTNKGSAGGSPRDVAIVHGGTVVANFLSDRFYLGPITDNTSTGGNARGQYAVDLQTYRSNAAYVAGGMYSALLGGRNNTASGVYSVVVAGQSNTSGAGCGVVAGQVNSASGSWAFVGAGELNTASGEFAGVVDGQSNIASGYWSFIGAGYSNTASAHGAWVAGGIGGVANRYGMSAHASGTFTANGDAQKVVFILRRKTTDSTPTNLGLDGSTTRLTIPSGKTMTGFLIVKGIKSDGSAKARFVRLCDITNVGGTTTLDTAVEAIGTDYNPSGCTLAVTAENATDDLQVNITAPAGETWRWVCTFNGLEIAYGT